VTEPRLVGTAAPKATGTAKVGARVTAAPGGWSAAPSSYTYQWRPTGRRSPGPPRRRTPCPPRSSARS
jgi:hypothetical protein